ncbi:MAG TPA: rRNA adenine N(6)-methyltransferase family protein [Dehalococcoidales bacterium]
MRNPKKHLHISYSQNEIVNLKIIEKLVNQSSITYDDLVYDIGAGAGAISMALLKKGARVIAIEKDRDKYLKCKEKFIGQDRFELYLDDFLLKDFPTTGKYKVFSNIPFFHTAEIVNKILFNENPPEDSYLILQKEAAEKYTGIPKDTLASLTIKPLFWIDIIYHFNRTDFYPVPSVDIVLLQIEKRRCQLIPTQYYNLYKDFLISLREGADNTIKKSLKQLFTYAQVKRLAKLLRIDFRSSPTDLDFTQYLCLFQFYLGHNLRGRSLIQGAEQKLRQQQANIIKIHRTRSI